MEDFLHRWKRYFTFAALLSCFVNVLQLTFPFYMFTIYRNVVVSYSGFSLVAITVVAIYALFMFGVFHYIRSRLLSRAGLQLHNELRARVFSGILKGHVVAGSRSYQQGMADLDTLRDFFSGNAVYPLFDAPWAPFYLILIYFIHPVLGFIATAGALVMVGLSVLQEFLIRDSMTKANIRNNRNQQFVDAFLRNTEVINGMGMNRAVADRFERDNRKVILNQTKSSRYAGTIQSIIKPMQNVIQVLIYCAGAYYAMTQGFSVGLMVAASIIMGRGLAPLMQAMGTWKFTMQARQAYKRLDGFVRAVDAVPEKMPLPAPRGHYRLEEATYRTGGQVLLAGVSFGLNPGEFLGVIGPSGAGKTTLCRMLLGMWPPVAGHVYLDGMEVFRWDKEEAGKKIGYLPQELELFPATVAENIARLGEVDMEKVKAAAELCGITELLESLPNGFDTMLEAEGGVKLSGGQKQIVGMARALYGDPNILVLDEPTSNLDEQTESLIITILAGLKQKRNTTCIMVTHKPEILQSMDRVLVLRQGRLAMFGPKNEVFAKLAAGRARAESEAV